MAILRTPNGEREFPLDAERTTIGRDPACEIRVTSGQASRRHAVIVRGNGGFVIEDLQSVNGTIVNGERITAPRVLHPQDRIEIGGLALTFHDEQTPGGGSAPTLSSAALATITSTLDLAGGLRVEVAPQAKLRAVLEISNNLSTALDVREVLPKILDSLFTVFPQAERGVILLLDPDSGELVPRATKQRHGEVLGPLPVSQTILNHALVTGQAILSADAGHDQRFDLSQSVRLLQIRSIMCVPMLSQTGAKVGVIQIDTQDMRAPFRQEDLAVLISASTQAARALELTKLHQERRELEAAIEIQKSFLPAGRPQVPGLHFFDHYSAARHIGGDYYDYIPLPGNRLGVALGDVAGKGVAAALLMARLSAAARFCLASEPTVSQAVRHLNSILSQNGSAERHVTFVTVVIDLTTFSMTLVNAGHPPPLRRRAGKREVEALGEEVADLPLGFFERPYEEVTLPLEAGDTVVLYTDGVTEARGADKQLYGFDRLRAVIQSSPPGAEAIGKAILADVRAFTAGRSQSDDLAIVCFGREP
jgi:serine phosphatase RsbU (regulator of sigma subunit)/pSer/pThr/pTyr-binding forkhead associated (FHA) protein